MTIPMLIGANVRVQSLRRKRLAELQDAEECGSSGGRGGAAGGGDADEDREAALLRLRLAALQAAEQRAMLRQARAQAPAGYMARAAPLCRSPAHPISCNHP